jgi:hypothetical protein
MRLHHIKHASRCAALQVTYRTWARLGRQWPPRRRLTHYRLVELGSGMQHHGDASKVL